MHVDPRPRAVPFAHASEAELARILDYYGIAWEYEPRPFPILWNLDGAVVESFTPDFHLPELDLYIELTTLRQSLVRKKNRKLRRLRELYPDVRIKLFYARDFRALMLKYGRIGLLDSLSGAEGQATRPRIEAEPESGRGRAESASPAAASAPPAADAVIGSFGETPAGAASAGDEADARSGDPIARSAAGIRTAACEPVGADGDGDRAGNPPPRAARGGGDRRRGARRARAPQASRA